MAAFSVMVATSLSPNPLQSHRFSNSSSSTYPQGSLLHNWKIGVCCTDGLRHIALKWRQMRTLTCAVNQDAKETIQNTVELDNLIDVLGELDPQDIVITETGYASKGSFCVSPWSEFAKRVSGEWDGFGADFNNEGKAIELPESVVPQAYRDWEVKVFDWQTQCPTLADPDNRVLVYKSIQLLPTVGCEADAATRYSIDDRKVGGENNGVTAFAYQSGGSYIAVWGKRDNLLELEYCLICPLDFESRVRIIQLIDISDNATMVLQSIRVFREQWYGPFRNGEQLGGCAIHDSAFASTTPLTASQVAGIWQGTKAVATFGTPNNEIFQELLDDKVHKSVRDGDNNILLPKELWCSLRQSSDGETLSEVGWLLDNGQAITSSCTFSRTAMLKEISISLETKASEDI